MSPKNPSSSIFRPCVGPRTLRSFVATMCELTTSGKRPLDVSDLGILHLTARIVFLGGRRAPISLDVLRCVVEHVAVWELVGAQTIVREIHVKFSNPLMAECSRSLFGHYSTFPLPSHRGHTWAVTEPWFQGGDSILQEGWPNFTRPSLLNSHFFDGLRCSFDGSIHNCYRCQFSRDTFSQRN